MNKNKKLLWLVVFILVSLLIMGGSMFPGTVNPNQVITDQSSAREGKVQSVMFAETSVVDLVLVDVQHTLTPDPDLPPGCCTLQPVPTQDFPPGYIPTGIPTITPTEIEGCSSNGELPVEICLCEKYGQCNPIPTPQYPPGYTPNP